MSTYTRGDAAGLLALAIGVPNKDWLSGWSSHEIGCGVGCKHPQNNLWACGQAAPGATDYNDHGVKNYPSLMEAIAATAANLHSPHHPAYGLMIADLQHGLTDSANIRAGLETWCGSTCYSQSAGGFVADGKAHNGDQFDDSGGTGVQPQSNLLKSCVLGLPGQCPTDYTCWPIGPSGAPLCNPGFQLNPFSPARCFPPDQISINGITIPCDDGSGHTGAPPPTATSALNSVLPAWIAKPAWTRITKALLGLALIGFGFLLLFALLTEKAEGNPAVKAVTKAAALGA